MGLQPDGIIGHSLGEVACGYADGCISQKEAILAAYWRGQCIKEANIPPGAMAAVGRCCPLLPHSASPLGLRVSVGGGYLTGTILCWRWAEARAWGQLASHCPRCRVRTTLTPCPAVPRMTLEPGILAHGGVGRGQRDFHMNPLGQAAGRGVGLLTLGTGRVGDGRRPERARGAVGRVRPRPSLVGQAWDPKLAPARRMALMTPPPETRQPQG